MLIITDVQVYIDIRWEANTTVRTTIYKLTFVFRLLFSLLFVVNNQYLMMLFSNPGYEPRDVAIVYVDAINASICFPPLLMSMPLQDLR